MTADVKPTLGLRSQIVLALLGLMILAFVPLFFAVTSVTRAMLDPERGAIAIRFLALFIGLFALALLVFAYLVLTRIIVRPVEALSDAAERVATGARSFQRPKGGAQEIVRLGESVSAMTTRLLADERAMRGKVDELTRATERLKEAQAQLVHSERMASVGRLAAGVAHEIGNPIAALMGLQDLLLDGGIDEETTKDFLQRMRKETERIHVVVRDLLDFARPEKSPRASMADVSTRVSEVVEDVFALVRPQKEFRDVRLEFASSPDGAVPHVRMAAARLTQVVLNLVLNAGAALSGRSSGLVVVRAHPDADENFVRIEVDDDGPGIPADLVDHVFEPFVTTKETGTGMGLGLSVCRGLVESVGGTISVDADYGAGARIVLRLPRAAPA